MDDYAKCYDPREDGFPYHRLLTVAAQISKEAGAAAVRYSYGAHNPLCMARDETDEAIRFCDEIERIVRHYKTQALQAQATRTSRLANSGEK